VLERQGLGDGKGVALNERSYPIPRPDQPGVWGVGDAPKGYSGKTPAFPDPVAPRGRLWVWAISGQYPTNPRMQRQGDPGPRGTITERSVIGRGVRYRVAAEPLADPADPLDVLQARIDGPAATSAKKKTTAKEKAAGEGGLPRSGPRGLAQRYCRTCTLAVLGPPGTLTWLQRHRLRLRARRRSSRG